MGEIARQQSESVAPSNYSQVAGGWSNRQHEEMNETTLFMEILWEKLMQVNFSVHTACEKFQLPPKLQL